jgi:hypothetical protein
MNLLLSRRRSGAASPAPVGATSKAAKFRSVECWIEDHGTALVATGWVLCVGSISVLLAWKTTKVITLAGEFEPILEVLTAVTAGALTLGRLIGKRRERRRAEQGAPGPYTMPGSNGVQPREGHTIGGAPELPPPAMSDSG